jgi:hypothetical protein
LTWEARVERTGPAKDDAARAALPLSGIRVLDVASFIAAPVAATVLGDYGADGASGHWQST